MSSLESIILSCVRKEHSYSVRKVPAKPVQLIEEAAKEGEGDRKSLDHVATICCDVCQQHISRYSCPRCSIKYCSLECYKNHGDGAQGNCTEHFFLDRTVRDLNLDVKENMERTKKSIQRQYNQQISDDDQSTLGGITKDTLLDMLRSLEEGDEAKVQRLLESEEIRQALSHSLENGDLLDYILEKWNPWWRLEIAEQCVEVDEERHNQPTFDERILSIPAFSTLLPNFSKIPDLRYNLVDILYSTSWTLRLYHGYENSMDCAVDAAETLWVASAVLSRDARWDSLPAVLSACTTHSTKALRNGCNTTWSCLTEDVALILDNHRFLAKALFEMIDILHEASCDCKRAKDKESAARFRKGRKKVEFFVSWSREISAIESLNGLSGRIRNWSSEWELPWAESDELYSQGGMRISFPTNGPEKAHESTIQPLLEPVESKNF